MDAAVITLQNEVASLRALEALNHSALGQRVDGVTSQLDLIQQNMRTLQLAINATATAGTTSGEKKARLDFQAATDGTPTHSWGGLEDRKVHWKEFVEEIMNYTSALYAESKDVLQEVEKLPEGAEVDTLHINSGVAEMVELLNISLYGLLYKYTADNARRVVVSAGRGNGLQGWHDLCHYARPVSVSDEHSEYFKILNPARAKDEQSLGLTLNIWTAKVHEFEKRYAVVEERSKKVGLLA